MFRITVQDRQGTRTFTFLEDSVTIGRGPERDLVLDVEDVSRLHAEVRFDRARGQIVLENRAREPIRRARGRVRRSAEIDPREWLSFGSIQLRIEHDDFALTPSAPAEERAFLAALHDDPRDDATRAVYADWLEERGDAARAEFLRAQIAARAADGGADAAGFAAASARLVALAPQVEVAWRSRVAMARVRACGEQAVGRPGFVAFELECSRGWDEMAPTATEGVRHCTACEKDVVYCTTLEQAFGWAEEGGCVAVDMALASRPADLVDPRTMVRGRPAPNVASRGARRR